MKKPKTASWRKARARKAGLVGGVARSYSLSPERRIEIARMGAMAMHKKRQEAIA